MPADSREERSARKGRREVRLTPPPRVEAAPSATPAAEWTPARSSGDGSHVLKWLTVLGIVALAGVAVAVFVVLPEWAEQQREGRREISQGGSEVAGAPGAEQVERSLGSPPHPDPLPQGGEGAGVEDDPTVSDPPAVAEAAPPASAPRPAVVEAPSAPRPRQSRVVAIEAGGEAPTADEFARAMTLGLAALERDDFAAAQTAFEQARALDPDSPQPVDGLARAEAGLRRTLIGELRGQAMVLEVREDWRDALELYEKVLAIDPTVLFAQQGRDRTLERADLSDHARLSPLEPGAPEHRRRAPGSVGPRRPGG